MNSGFIGSEYDFSLFDPNTFSAEAEKKLVARLLKAPFIDDPWIRRRLASYVLEEAWERDRIVLQLVEFFFRDKVPADLFAAVREFDSVLAALGKRGHFVHQFEVLIFGWAVISMLINHNTRLQDTFRFDAPREVFSVWLMASVVHDFGYPLQMGRDVMEKLYTWYRALGMYEVAELYKVRGTIRNEKGRGPSKAALSVLVGL